MPEDVFHNAYLGSLVADAVQDQTMALALGEKEQVFHPADERGVGLVEEELQIASVVHAWA